MGYDTPALLTKLDDIYASTGALGYALLLSGSLTAVAYTVDTSTDLVTTASDHGWVTGTRVRFTTTGTQPTLSSSSLGSRDWFINVASTDTFTIHNDLASAIAGTPTANFTGAGSGTLTVTEQLLVMTDPIEVLIAHELTHPDYVRTAIEDVGAAEVSVDKAVKNAAAWTVSAGVGNGDLTFAHIFIILGGSSTIGDTTGTSDTLYTPTTPVTIAEGNSQYISVRFSLGNAV